MTIYELEETLKHRKMGKAYEIWKQSILNTYVMSPDMFPKTPEEACPELYPPKKTYKMPNFLKGSKHKKIV